MNNKTLFFRKTMGRSISIGLLFLAGTLTNTAMAVPVCVFARLGGLLAEVAGVADVLPLDRVFVAPTITLGPGCDPALTAIVGTGTKAQTVTLGLFSGQRCNFTVTLTDSDGGTCSIDPIFTTLKVDTGHTAIQTFNNLPENEPYIDVVNSSFGLKKLVISVNGKHFKKLKLKNNKTYHINVADAMLPGKVNTLTFVGKGKVGSSAEIAVGDTPPAADVASPDKKAQNKGIGGLLADELEDNTSDQVALASKQEIHLEVATALDAKLATDASRYQVTVNGTPVTILQVIAKRGDEGTELTLLPQLGSFIIGDKVQVSWNLKDAKKHPLSGNVDLIAE